MHSFACISDLLTSDWCKQENPSLFNNWNNDVRMQALFARIPYTSYPTSRTSHDPYHRLHSTPSSSSSLSQTITTKFDFWADLLVWVMRTEPRLLTAGDGGSEGRGGDGRKPPASYSRLAISITSSSQFASKFKRKALVPLGLNSVLAHLIDDRGILIEKKEFMKLPQTTWSGWALETFVKAPVSWGVHKLYQTATNTLSTSNLLEDNSDLNAASGDIRTGCFIVKPIVEAMAEQLLAFVYARAHFLSTDYIITIDQLQALANESLCSNNNNNNNQQQRQPPLSSEDLSILVHHLIKTGAAKCRYSDEKQKYTLVKFRIPSTTSSSHHEQRISDITETDLGIINLKHTISIIHGQVDLLKSTIAGCIEDARIAVSTGQREKALYLLKKKKRSGETLTARLGSLDTMELILSKIQAAESDAQILSAYDLGAETLKQLLAANPQLNPDAIAMTMDKVAETLADQAEVEDAITVGNQIIANNSGASNMDEDELMKELEQIIEEKKKEEEDMAKLEKLDNVIPNAPTYLPNPPTTTSNTTTTIIETTEDYTQLSDDQIGSVLDGLLEKEMKSLKLEDEKMEEKGSKNQQDLKKKKEGKVAILAEY